MECLNYRMKLKIQTIFILFIISVSFCNNNDLETNYENFDYILNSFVDHNGRVDYSQIRNNPYRFNQYFDFIKNISPISHPELFPTENDQKAYWINVYNAVILKLMIDNPDKDILDISLFKHAIFLKKYTIGGKKISPLKIENKILRKQYNDPRIHFAINCASNSCPPLGNRIFIGDSLDYQLDQKTINYINNPANVIINHDTRTIYVNKIFKWFKKDFTKNFNSVNGYLYKYLDKNNLSIPKEEFLVYKIKYAKYDWSINKQ